MLRSLSIRNYALIDSLDVQFPGGLVVISGETGAGKSILLGALSLLMGSRTDVSRMGDRTENCVVEGEFEDESGQYIIRRVISPAGRSRVFVNDEPVGMEELKNLCSQLMDIHAQFEHSRLADSGYRLSVLDSFAGISPQAEKFAALYARRCEAAAGLSTLEQRIAVAQQNSDYVRYQYERLEKAALREGELEELEAEQKRLSGIETINENLASVSGIFSGEEGSLGGRLKALENSLDAISKFIPEFAGLSSRVASARVELDDIEYEASSLGGKLSFSPQRMQEVDDRLSTLYDLMRRHNVKSVAELIALRDSFASTISDASDAGEEMERLKAELAALDAQCDAVSAELSAARKGASGTLAEVLQNLVRSLEMPRAVFEVRVSPARRTSSGDDAVEFWFSANGGVATKPLSKCASGGELSRIMLCIKKIMSEYMCMPTMIFDEIDTGVSGSVADRMGRMIVEMGRRMQIFTITHLPQVASKGSAHYLVFKQQEGGVTRSRLRLLEGEERISEIARMLSGETLTAEALANARVLLEN